MTESKKHHVLVVDDIAEIREALVQLLRFKDYDASDAANGTDALLAIARLKPDVLVTDRDMPRMNGERLATDAKRITPGIKVIMITANDVEAIRDAATIAGVDRVLEKPVLIEDLDAAIREVLAAAQIQK